MAKTKKLATMSVGKRIAALRKIRGFTMSRLAELTGLTQPQISHYENDQNLPNANALVSLSKAFEVSIDYLLLGENSNAEKNPVAFYLITSEDKKFFDGILKELLRKKDEIKVS
jgi:transcriptional regulator with XRE-family HTH domain